MRQKHRPEEEPAETVVKEIRCATRKHYSAEEKIRIVLGGLRLVKVPAKIDRTAALGAPGAKDLVCFGGQT